LALACAASAAAQQPEPTERKVQNPIGVAQEETKALRKVSAPAQLTITVQLPSAAADELIITSAKQEDQGDVAIATGDVHVSYSDMRLIADRVTHNKATEDVLAEGNVFFEQAGQMLTASRLEFNLKTRRGTLFEPTAFTNRTPDGTVLVVDAARADK